MALSNLSGWSLLLLHVELVTSRKRSLRHVVPHVGLATSRKKNLQPAVPHVGPGKNSPAP